MKAQYGGMLIVAALVTLCSTAQASASQGEGSKTILVMGSVGERIAPSPSLAEDRAKWVDSGGDPLVASLDDTDFGHIVYELETRGAAIYAGACGCPGN
jgi:hypothetical protein